MDEAVVRIVLQDAGAATAGAVSSSAGLTPSESAGSSGGVLDVTRFQRITLAGVDLTVTGFRKTIDPVLKELRSIRELLDQSIRGDGTSATSTTSAGIQSNNDLVMAMRMVEHRIKELNVNLNPEVQKGKQYGYAGPMAIGGAAFYGAPKAYNYARDFIQTPSAEVGAAASTGNLAHMAATSAAKIGQLATQIPSISDIGSMVSENIDTILPIAAPLVMGALAGAAYKMIFRPNEEDTKERSTNEWLELIAQNTGQPAGGDLGDYVQGILTFTAGIDETTRAILDQLTPSGGTYAETGDPSDLPLEFESEMSGAHPTNSPLEFVPPYAPHAIPVEPQGQVGPEWNVADAEWDYATSGNLSHSGQDLIPSYSTPKGLRDVSDSMGLPGPADDNFYLTLHDPWEGWKPTKFKGYGLPSNEQWSWFQKYGIVGADEARRSISKSEFENLLAAVKADTSVMPDAFPFARGGHVGGPQGTDTVPAWLTPGEVVVPREMVDGGAVDHLRGQLPGFHRGGYVRYMAKGGVGMAAVGLLGAAGKFGMNQSIISADADADTSKAVDRFGQRISAVGGFLSNYLPVIGGLTKVTGEMTSSFSTLMKGIDGTAQRYGQYSPEMSQATAIADMRKTLADFKRAQDIGTQMAEYIEANSDLQQKIEDKKVKFLAEILPVATRMLEFIEKMIPQGDDLGRTVQLIAAGIEPLLAMMESIAKRMGNWEDERRSEKFVDPTTQILRDNKFLETTEEGGAVPNL